MFWSYIIYNNDTVTPEVNISEQFRTNHAEVILEWSHNNGVTYSISVDPEVALNYTGRNSVKLIVSYDTKYNVSVIVSLCGKNETTLSVLHYGKHVINNQKYV